MPGETIFDTSSRVKHETLNLGDVDIWISGFVEIVKNELRKLRLSANIFATSFHNLTCSLVGMSSQRWHRSVMRKHCSAPYNYKWQNLFMHYWPFFFLSFFLKIGAC